MHLDILKTYWDTSWTDLQTIRQHAWGGTVQHRFIDTIDKTLYFKRFSIRNPRYLHKPPRARATVLKELTIYRLGFSTAPIMGLIEKRVAGVLWDSAVISEELIDAQPAFMWLNPQGKQRVISEVQRETLVTSIGNSVGAWHNAGLFHGDMHMGNIMCSLNNKDEVTVSWLDNEEGKVYSRIPEAKRQNDLGHIARFAFLTPEHEQRLFWETYTRTCMISGDEKRNLTDRIISDANRYWKKKGIDYSVG